MAYGSVLDIDIIHLEIHISESALCGRASGSSTDKSCCFVGSDGKYCCSCIVNPVLDEDSVEYLNEVRLTSVRERGRYGECGV